LTWGGIGPSGFFATFNQGGGVGSFDYEPPRGDVSGVVDNLIVIGLQSNPVASNAPISGNVLAWDGNNWRPTDVNVIVSGTHNLLSLTHSDTIPATPTPGDIIAGSGLPTKWVRFPIGEPGQHLRVSSSGELTWAYDPLEIITSGAIIDLASFVHRIIINKTVGSPTDVNLPVGPFFGQEVIIKDGKGDAGVNNITIAASGFLIDGLSFIKATQAYQSYTLIWNGSNWNII